MSTTALVTGGAGFIGSHLVDSLVADGFRVRVFDDFSTGQASNLAHHGERIELVSGTLTDASAVANAMQGIQFVFHLGAMASVAKSLEDPAACHAVCATGTLHVLDAARKAGIRRVVYTASSSAYGPASDPAGQTEETPLQPLSPYAAAKLAGEDYLQAFAASYSLETVRVRFFNIFGPRQRADSPYSGVIAIFVAAMMAGRTPTIHGDGMQVRDFTYVENAVRSLRLAAEKPGISGRVYNAGTGRGVTLLDLVAALNTILGTNISPNFGPARVGDVRFSKARIERIQNELGFHATVTFEEGLRRTVAWYRSLQA
jgi:UDP-glucose 4-epimerase